jgi:hypothetical protein
MRIEITTVGNSAGIILRKELLARLRVGKSDGWSTVPDSRFSANGGKRSWTFLRFAADRACGNGP